MSGRCISELPIVLLLASNGPVLAHVHADQTDAHGSRPHFHLAAGHGHGGHGHHCHDLHEHGHPGDPADDDSEQSRPENHDNDAVFCGAGDFASNGRVQKIDLTGKQAAVFLIIASAAAAEASPDQERVASRSLPSASRLCPIYLRTHSLRI